MHVILLGAIGKASGQPAHHRIGWSGYVDAIIDDVAGMRDPLAAHHELIFGGVAKRVAHAAVIAGKANAAAHRLLKIGQLAVFNLRHRVDRHDQTEFTKLWVREGRRRGLGPDVKPFLAQHFADNRGALLGLVAAPAAPYDQRVAHFPLRPILICLTRQAWKVSRIESTCAQRSADVLATPEPEFWMPLYALDAIRPTLPVAGRCWIAPNAQIIGRVILGEDCGIWFGAVLRGDNEAITLGARTNIQEGSTLHTDMGSPLTIGEDCTIGHNAILHGCTIGAGSLIGMGAIVLNGARIGEGCLVGAGALVTEGKSFPDHSLIVGSPAKAIRTLDEAAIAGLRQSAAHYVANWKRFAGGLRPIED